jgi:aminomuconate-semialdehyde/2-hydroxymuconate-6-semialdehyde dehydrogenase
MFLNYINGEFCSGSEGVSFENVCPVDGSLIGEVSEASRSDVDRAVRSARAALAADWGRMPLTERVQLLYRVAAAIEERFDDFLQAECLDTGKPEALARNIDIPRGAANFRVFADVVKNVPTESFQLDTPDGGGALNYALRRPKGVVGIISPWNLPLLLTTWKLGPALACGNTVVVKPSEETPATATLLAQVMDGCGVPPGVFNVLHGRGPDSAGEFLSRHPGIDAITFTGETRTGEAVMQAAAVGLRDISLECGGKNPALVFSDCDMDQAIDGTMRSVFANSGQVCLGTERIYVQRPIFDEFVARLAQNASALVLGRPGDPETTMGPLVSREHRDKVLSYYALAREEGATTVLGGGIPDLPENLAGGAWVEPTIWTDLPLDARVVREEIFGPCCHIQPFDTEAEAIAMANDTDYGLAAVVWTGDLLRGHRVAARLKVGVTWVNSWFLRDLRTAFGGAGQSGIGREGGVHSLEFYTETCNVCVKLQGDDYAATL